MRLTRYLKDSFVAGVILLAPLAVTLYVLRLLVSWLLQFVNPLVASTRLAEYAANVEIAAQILAVGLILGAVTLIGTAAQWSIGEHVFGNVGRAIYIVPLVSTIYSGVRQVATALVDRDSQYESVVLVEYPREGLYSIGLVTGEGETGIDRAAGERAVSVFLPNSPNPTAGRLVMVPPDQVYETDLSVREGMRLIVTTGITSRPDEGVAASGQPTPDPADD